MSAIAVAAVAWPMTWNHREDSFPLTSYPMFSDNVSRAPRVFLPHARGIRGPDDFVTLDKGAIANQEVLQTHRTLWRAVHRGHAAQLRLCDEIAHGLAERDAPAYRDVRVVQLVRSEFDAIEYFVADDPPPSHTAVYVSCRVPGR